MFETVEQVRPLLQDLQERMPDARNPRNELDNSCMNTDPETGAHCFIAQFAVEQGWAIPPVSDTLRNEYTAGQCAYFYAWPVSDAVRTYLDETQCRADAAATWKGVAL